MIPKSTDRNIFEIYIFLIILISLFSCKEKSGQQDSKTENIFSFDLNNHVISTEEGIEKIEYLEVKSEKVISMRSDGYEIVKYQDNKIYAINRYEDELYIIDNTGKIIKTIYTKSKDFNGPTIIRDFTLSREHLIIFQKNGNKFYFYTLLGDYIDVKQIPDTIININSITFLEPNHLVLQKYHDGLKTSIARSASLVGKILDLTTFKVVRSINYQGGGSESRDKVINMRFTEVENGNLYNYRLSRELTYITEAYDKDLFELDATDLFSLEDLNWIDNNPPVKASQFYNNELRSNGKIDALHFYYMNDDIYFMLTFWKSKMYWIFYNSKKDQYKVMKFQPMTIHNHKGTSFVPYVKNAKENYFMVFMDGQAMQVQNAGKKFNQNSAYFIKIYPKYLNQSAWEW